MAWVPLQSSHRRVVFFASAVAAGAHLTAAFDHSESSLLAAVFVTVAVVQIGSGAWLLRVADRRASFLVGATTVVLLAAWAASRTVGLAIGHSHGPERAAALDITAAVAQVVVLFAIVGGWSRGTTTTTPWRRAITAFAVALAVAGFASRANGAPAGHHVTTPYAGTPEQARDDRREVPSPVPAPSMASESEAEPAAPAGHDHCSGAACEPHDHP